MCLRLYHPRHRTQAPSTSPPVGSLPVEFCKPPCHTLSHPGSEEPTRANSKEPPFPRLRGASTHHRGPTFPPPQKPCPTYSHPRLEEHPRGPCPSYTPAQRSLQGDHSLYFQAPTQRKETMPTPQLGGASTGTMPYTFFPTPAQRSIQRDQPYPSSEEHPRGLRTLFASPHSYCQLCQRPCT